MKFLCMKAGVVFLVLQLLLATGIRAASSPAVAELPAGAIGARTFAVKGVVQEIRADQAAIVVKHDAIAGYMDAMTMPFNVKDRSILAGFRPGDLVTFQLHITEDASWIDGLVKVGAAKVEVTGPGSGTAQPQPQRPRHPLLSYQFTNELGQAVALQDFHGQALAITFFFTRCPVPDFCPRLSKNFEEASQKLAAMPGAPTNWHFLSITFDPQMDTPAVLKAYGENYHYNPAHWSFLTGPTDKIDELARLSDVQVQREGAFINHNFRTLIVDAQGHLQMIYPMGGNLSDAIVDQMLKAAAATGKPPGVDSGTAGQSRSSGDAPAGRPAR